MKYLIDFETKSSLSLIHHGAKQHLNTPESDIVCMAWKQRGGYTKLWIPGMPIPFKPEPTDRIYAHNIQFDFEVWHTLGYKYNLTPFKLEQCVDVMALCGRYTYPQGLAEVGKVLQLRVQKNRRGKTLMKKICQPPFKYTKAELHEFYEYCITDVNTMDELISALPRDELDPMEQKIWVMTAKINQKGVPIDVEAVTRIRKATDHYKKKEMKRVADITDGEVQTVNQTAAIISWAEQYGAELKNLQAKTVDLWIDRDIDDRVTKLLKLRKELAATSTAKYKKLLDQQHAGRIYDNLRYYAAATGRWGGLGFQIHNLPRARVQNPEAEIEKFTNSSIFKENPIQSAKALIRSMIKAPKGKEICAVDYSAIENVGLLWVAGQEDKLDAIRREYDHYKLFAASVYNVPYGNVTDEQRFLGKTGVLGAGYNAAAGAFLAFARSYGVLLTFEQAKSVIDIYREEHPKVKSLWYRLRDCAIAAVDQKGRKFTYNNCVFQVIKDRNGGSWLALKLPSGRYLVYNSPEIETDKYGPVVTHMGINSYTKKWSRLKLIPGRITENVVQAIARDILAHGKLNLMKAGYNIIASVHDEVILEVKPKKQNYINGKKVGNQIPTLDHVIKLMTKLPDWCPDLPLKADGFIEKRYRK